MTAKTPSGQRNQHERFVRDAIARSLLTLPFAHLDTEPFGEIYGYYKQLQAAAESASPDLPATDVLVRLVELVRWDAAIHESAGNYLKADIEHRWCEGIMLHFTWGQGLVTP